MVNSVSKTLDGLMSTMHKKTVQINKTDSLTVAENQTTTRRKPRQSPKRILRGIQTLKEV